MIKNKYNILGDTVHIYLNTKYDGIKVCFVDLEDFNTKIKDITVTWIALWLEGSKTYYVRAWSLRENKTRRAIYIHRIICGLEDTSSLVPDHLDHNGLNNRRNNLQVKTPSKNKHNFRRVNPTNKSGTRNVFYRADRGVYIASIGIAGKRIYKSFFHKVDAIAYIDKIKKEYLNA